MLDVLESDTLLGGKIREKFLELVIKHFTGCRCQRLIRGYLSGGFKYFLFSPLFGEDFQFD